MAASQKTPLARQRRVEILSELEDRGSVRVTNLAQRFGVAEETIRRDLDKLSQEGRVARTHGGALSIRNQRFDLPAAVRRNTLAAEKRRIAYQALSHIEENDVLALDASTTVLELVCILPDIPLTVITHGIDAARLLADRPQIQVICTGGELDAKSTCLLGPIAEESLRRFAINKAFFSCKGVDLERGCSEASIAHASIKRLLMQLTGQSFLLVDHSKFGVRSMAYSGSVYDVDNLITDDATDQSFIDTLRKGGVATEVASSGVLPIVGRTG
ncbi:MAG: DeoR/GlpR family DNA-binding transcription regulator [Pirellulales bacterium]|nr:DeoR/GlpR family DNA-binding transcription regulator [Pirellulales bacterium]